MFAGHHEGHGVHLCHRCGWPFPNPHPSAKHRRAHKKICGTIEGYTNIIGSEVVSDDDHLSDDDKEKSPML
ncbi:putative transcription factor C2H2 family [Helianthus annuus]|nr:putative transcription factor C2H2 family [Helianthus annuus]KAJ0787615.1 putative transcription factor C2H2 family [Helianthus annuus]